MRALQLTKKFVQYSGANEKTNKEKVSVRTLSNILIVKDENNDFTKAFTMFITNKDVTEKGQKERKTALKNFQMTLIIHNKDNLEVTDERK